MRKIGIMGGTFNPIHMGHLLLAESAADAFGLEEVWLIPTGSSYFKNPLKLGDDMLSPMDRFLMTQLAASDNPRLRCLDIEVMRQGDTYSYETLETLHAQFPECAFTFIIGADCLFSIEKWRCPERIFASCSILAALREGADLADMERKRAELIQRYDAEIDLFPFRHLEIASTDIRQMVKEGQSIRYLVPDAVYTYILDRGFYKR